MARKADGERKPTTEQAIIEQAQRELRLIWWRYTLWITVLMFVAPLVMTVRQSGF